MKKILFTMTLPVILTACGAADSLQSIDESLTETPVSVAAAAAAALPAASPYNIDIESGDIENASASSSELNQIAIQPSFDFETNRSVDVVLDISDVDSGSNFLNICTKFEGAGDAYQVDYDSCFLKTRLEGGYYADTVTLPNQHDALLAVVWPSEPGNQPIYRVIRSAEEGL